MIGINDRIISFFVEGTKVKDLKLSPGDIIKAEVINLPSPWYGNGMATLKIKGRLISVKSEIPLFTGRVLTLKVTGPISEGIFKLQLVDQETKAPETTDKLIATVKSLINDIKGFISQKSLKSDNRIERIFQQLLKILPEDSSLLPLDIRKELVKLFFGKLQESREINDILDYLKKQGLMIMDIEDILTSSFSPLAKEGLFKTLIENAGILLETRIKNLLRSNEEVIPELLKDDLKANLLRMVGKEPMSKIAYEVIKKIETFQALSKVTDSFYTFFPLIWTDLRDADICFRRGKDKKRDNPFYCRINLNLKRSGKLSVMIILNNKNFFLSFMAEDAGFRKVIEENKALLQRSFVEKGLNLKAINVMAFKPEASDMNDGIDIRV